jgi:hypothetical protein
MSLSFFGEVMGLCIAQCKTVDLFYPRLSEPEKGMLRRATVDGLEAMLRYNFSSDMVSLEVLIEAKKRAHEEMRNASHKKGF